MTLTPSPFLNRRTLIAIVLVAAVAVAGFFWGGRQIRGPRVDAHHAAKEAITQTLLVSGRLAPPTRVELGSQVQSTVVDVRVDEGDEVQAGTILARLADEEAVSRLGEAEARLAEATARLQRVRGVGRALASERVQQTQLQLEQAESDFARSELLMRSASTTEATHYAIGKALDTARSQLVAAQLEAAATGTRGADTAAAVASLAGAQASVELARAGVERTRIRAPTDGLLLQRHVEPGQVVRPGDTLFELGSSGRLEVRVTPDELHLGSLSIGQEARVVVDAFPERPIRASVAQIAPQIDASRGTVEVRLALFDEVDELDLRPDMSATVEVNLGRRDRAMVLPTWLVRDLGTRAPWVLLEEDGIAERRPIGLGLVGDTTVEVLSGLDADDKVLAPDARIEPLDPVRTRALRSTAPDVQP